MQGTIDNNITIIGSFCLELSYFFLFGGMGVIVFPVVWRWSLGLGIGLLALHFCFLETPEGTQNNHERT